MKILMMLLTSFVVYAQEPAQPLKPIDVEDAAVENEVYNKTETPAEPPVETAKPVESKPAVPSAPDVKDTNEEVTFEPQHTPNSYASRFSILADIAPLSMWVPYKLGLTLGWQFQEDWAVEASYLQGKIDLDNTGVEGVGDAKEDRIDVVIRKYFCGSFSVFGGYSYQSVNAEASDQVRTDNPGLPFYDTTIKTHGVIAGIGNRWMWGSGFTLGVDWISAIIPLSNKVDNDFRDLIPSDYTDAQDRKDIIDAMDKIEKTPRLTLLHLKLGWTF